MTTPGFTAEASLYLSRHSYLTHKNAVPSGEIISAGLFGPPHINVSYQPPPFPQGMGFPGTLTVSGQNFESNAEVTLTINNCDAFPYQVQVLTDGWHEFCYELLGHRFCEISLGGNFTAAYPCYCGGVASVTAQDLSGNTASGTTNLPC
jgi:hypothetical protein